MAFSLDQCRLKKALLQEIRRLNLRAEGVDAIITQLPRLISVCGRFSGSRKMALRIGRALLMDPPVILAPSCPDYTHTKGRYTFRGLSGGVSLLSKKQIEFLKKVKEVFEIVSPIILIADLESEDGEIRRAVGKEKDEFDALVCETLVATRREAESLGWKAGFMTSIFPALAQEEREVAHWIAANPNFIARINSETISRVEMYNRINRHIIKAQTLF